MSIELQVPNQDTNSKQPQVLNSEENLLISPNNKPSNGIPNAPLTGGFPKGVPPGFPNNPPPDFLHGKPPEGFKLPEGFQPPEGFPQPPKGFKPPEGFQPPEGFPQPPEGFPDFPQDDDFLDGPPDFPSDSPFLTVDAHDFLPGISYGMKMHIDLFQDFLIFLDICLNQSSGQVVIDIDKILCNGIFRIQSRL